VFLSLLGVLPHGDVSAVSRGVDVVPATPTTRIIGIPAANPLDATVRIEVKGKAGEAFSLMVALRDLAGDLVVDPVTGLPVVVWLHGLTVPAEGCWSQTYGFLALSLALPDLVLEAVAIPAGGPSAPVGAVLSWRCELSSATFLPSAAPLPFSSQYVTVPGVTGTFLSTTLSAQDPLNPNVYFLAENGPGGVYPIG
jgi:hypothetical protein